MKDGVTGSQFMNPMTSPPSHDRVCRWLSRDENLASQRVGSRPEIQQLLGVFLVFDVAFVGEADSGA